MPRLAQVQDPKDRLLESTSATLDAKMDKAYDSVKAMAEAMTVAQLRDFLRCHQATVSEDELQYTKRAGLMDKVHRAIKEERTIFK